MTKSLIRALCFVLAFALAGMASAQSQKSTEQINGALNSFFGENGIAAVDPVQADAIDLAQFRFTHSAAVSREVKADFLDLFAAGLDAATRAQFQLFVDQMTPEFQQLILDDGFQSSGWEANNIADIVAATILVAFAVTQDFAETTETQERAIRGMMRVAFDDAPVTQTSDAEKQRLFEPMFFGAVLASIQREFTLEQDPDADLSDLKAGMKDILAGFGLHPELVVLGPEGPEASPRLVALTPQIEAGEITVEEAFPQVTADYARLGGSIPAAIAATPDMAGADDAGPTETVTDAPSAAETTVNPLGAKPDDPVSGVYSGGDLSVTLEPAPAGYSGTIVNGDASYPLTVSGDTQTLTGSFTLDDGASFDVLIRITGEQMILETGGADYTLEKQGPTNPLARN
ncbi:MAG: DUF6683 family protein [Pseudomonadota bacterium]